MIIWMTKDELKTTYNGDISLPCGDGQLNLWDWNKVADEIASVNEDMSCKHEWVNVGFHFDKWVCKKCDVNKGSNE